MSQTIGQKIRALRKSRNVSQEILCGIINMSNSTFSYKERESRFTTDELQKICNALNCPYEVIISDAPFNPMQINFERTDTVFVREPEPEISIFRDSDPIYLTDSEADLHRRYRNLSPEKRQALLDFLKKIETGEK